MSAGGGVSGDEDDPDEPVPIAIDGTLDLHTFRPRDVGELVPDWIGACRDAGILEVRVVHGKGTGQLRRSVEAILGRTPGVVSWRQAPPDRGGWGATIVTLAPRDAGGDR